MSVKKAVIPAAGLGTRVLPVSKAMPKEMLPIVDKPAIQYIVEEAVASGITDILIITNRGKDVIEDHFDHSIELDLALRQKGRDEIADSLAKLPPWLTYIFCARRKQRGWVTPFYRHAPLSETSRLPCFTVTMLSSATPPLQRSFATYMTATERALQE